MENLFYKSGALYCAMSETKKEYFYEEGTLKTLELENETLLYWPNGKIKRKCPFSQGVRHGLDQMWNEMGHLVDEGCYEMGRPIGIHRRFNSQGALIEEIEYLEPPRFNLKQWDDEGELRVEALWKGSEYLEKTWDRFEHTWVEKKGVWNGKKLVYV